MSDRRVSTMAGGLVGSEILKIAADIRTLVGGGAEVCNLTVGDFSPKQFRIPAVLEREIIQALQAGETNYPPSEGVPDLRRAIGDFYRRWLGLDYGVESILVTGGSRPGIHSVYTAVVDPGDTVLYPVPSWNNNHYVHLTGARGVPIVCRAEDAFLPTRATLEPHIRGARLLALNSPLNPSGTCFTAEALTEICDLVLEENARRGPDERPLYVMYDQVYWMLTFDGTQHVNPVSLRPEMRDYTLFVDGISKAFAATGVRVGWTVAPEDVTKRMGSVLGHVGAWAPRAEQIATAKLLDDLDAISTFRESLIAGVQQRLQLLFSAIQQFKAAGHAVDAIEPMGAIYLSARFNLVGRTTRDGTRLASADDVRKWLLEEAGMAVVPFDAFGSTTDEGWFRLSVGAVSIADIEWALPRLRAGLESLT